jgi:hypothetical protein
MDQTSKNLSPQNNCKISKVTIILGLCGSGKTWHADRLIREGKALKKFDENFLSRDFPGQPEELVQELRSGNDCVVVEIAFCLAPDREAFLTWLKAEVPDVVVEWLCIENDLEKANKNCRARPGKDAEEHIAINLKVSPNYKYPDNAPEPIPVFEIGPDLQM